MEKKVKVKDINGNLDGIGRKITNEDFNYFYSNYNFYKKSKKEENKLNQISYSLFLDIKLSEKVKKKSIYFSSMIFIKT